MKGMMMGLSKGEMFDQCRQHTVVIYNKWT